MAVSPRYDSTSHWSGQLGISPMDFLCLVFSEIELVFIHLFGRFICFSLTCMNRYLHVCVCEYHRYAWYPRKTWRLCQILCNWCYRRVKATTSGLRTKSMSFPRTGSVLNSQAISPALDPAEERLANPKVVKKTLLCYLLTILFAIFPSHLCSIRDGLFSTLQRRKFKWK